MKHEAATETQVETYLRRATRGLWGKKRLEVREELAAHLHERALSYQIAGLRETDAVKKALAELGKPQEVSLGMAKLYTFPKLAGSGIIFAALCVLTLAAWPHTAAQGVKSIFYLPTKECVRALEPGSKLSISQACDSVSYDVWLERQELSQTLRKQGVTVKGNRILVLTFPGLQPVYVRPGAPGRPRDNIKPADPSYVSLWELVHNVEQRQLKLSVTGWNNPQIHFGSVAIQVGSDVRPVPGSAFYQAYLTARVSSDVAKAMFQQSRANVLILTPRTDMSYEDYNFKVQALEVVAKPGEVYGVITILEPNLLDKSLGSSGPDAAFFANLTSVFSMDTARVGEGGALELYLPEEPLQFVKSLGAHPRPGTAVLVKLSNSENQQGYKVVLPEQIRYQASKYEVQKP